MALPKYWELYGPFLSALFDGDIHKNKEISVKIAEQLHLTGAELAELLPSGTQTVLENRVGWAKTYLKKAGLIESPRKAHFAITSEGRRLLQSGVGITDSLLTEKYPAFAEFKYGVKKKPDDPVEPADPPETPPETLERVYKAINDQLADDLLTEIMNQPSWFFEKLVVDLMEAMNYGKGFVTKISGDDGIDGIIHEDKLGFNLIYIQAKRWNPSATIGKPEIHSFAGAMMGPPRVEKGLFITTAKFTQGAKDFANAQHIILLDGQKLTQLMIEYNLGVSTQKTYRVKRIDSDYFPES